MSDTASVEFPHEYLGAQMRIVDPDKPERGLASESYQLKDLDTFPLVVGLQFPCLEKQAITPHWMFQCTCTEGPHGHLVLQCDDGTTVIPAKIFSRPYAEKVIAALESFSDAEKHAMTLVLEESLGKLPLELHPHEVATLADEELFARAIRYKGWVM